ncbi:hypothetical protein EN786_09470 [Mesorhizobium sp. M4B.F.Ca.ET.143.01.1.1]|nr:hypothetical protein EOA31_31775 [Mesorhizobium sp. M4B.F.Ca.ET.049.02.1.2]RVD13755.1 hypothetical protein EN738_33760 [Mesorhizobium sp. M4B.F.Ca.ET.017.02.2.1]TGV27027.1 hypothetical protein EN786_09470 [Mesorhizobium sp. M4B.F.Ca.ET.143.01.1.1]
MVRHWRTKNKGTAPRRFGETPHESEKCDGDFSPCRQSVSSFHGNAEPLNLFALTQFRTENRFTLFLELLEVRKSLR